MNNPNADSDKIARKYMDSLIIEGRVLGAEKPSAKVTFLGTEFSTPIMAGALSHLKPGMAGYAEGARQAGAVACIGMGDNETAARIKDFYSELDAYGAGKAKPYDDFLKTNYKGLYTFRTISELRPE